MRSTVRPRWLIVGLAVVLLLTVVTVWRVRASGSEPEASLDAPSRVGGCQGFRGDGAKIGDTDLKQRALKAWQAAIARHRAEEQDQGIKGDLTPQVFGSVCVAYADTVADDTYVVLVNGGAGRATYTEDRGDTRGRISSTSEIDVLDQPALPITGGLWLVSRLATDVTVHVGDEQAQEATPMPAGSRVLDVAAIRQAFVSAHPGTKPDGRPAVVAVLTVGPTRYGLVEDPRGSGSYLDTRFGPAENNPALDAALAVTGAVPLVASVIQTDATGKTQRPGLTRDVTIVGAAEVPNIGSALVASDRGTGAAPNGSFGVQGVVNQDGEPSRLRLGTIPEFGRVGWAGGSWMWPNKDGTDPKVFIAAGLPPLGEPAPLSLEVRMGTQRVVKQGPVAVVSSADVPGVTLPVGTAVIGTTAAGSVVSPLGVDR